MWPLILFSLSVAMVTCDVPALVYYVIKVAGLQVLMELGR